MKTYSEVEVQRAVETVLDGLSVSVENRQGRYVLGYIHPKDSGHAIRLIMRELEKTP